MVYCVASGCSSAWSLRGCVGVARRGGGSENLGPSSGTWVFVKIFKIKYLPNVTGTVP